MKKFIKITAISLIIGFMFNALAQGLSASSYPPIKKVKEIPNWFLKPVQNEYVGVSLPLKDDTLAMQQAIHSAILSYMVQHEIYGILAKSITIISTIDGAKNTFSAHSKELYNLSFSQPSINYQVTKTAINNNGEFFVSLKVLPFKAESNVNLSLAGLLNANDYSATQFEWNEFIKYLFQATTGFSMLSDIFIQYTDNNQYGTIKSSILDVKTEKEEANLLDNSDNYGYKATKRFKYDAKKEYILSSYLLKQSLGAAYLTTLLKLTADEKAWTDEIKTDSAISYRYYYSKRNATAIDFMYVDHNELFIVAENKSSNEIQQQKEIKQGKDAQKAAKKLQKEGWKTLNLPIAKQLEELWLKQCEKDIFDYPKYIVKYAAIKGYNINNVTTLATYKGKERIASEINDAMKNLIKRSIKNGELTKENGLIVLDKLDAMAALDLSLATDTIKEGTSITHIKESAEFTPIIAELTDVIKVLEIYRECTDKSMDVQVGLVFDTHLITDVTKRTLRKMFADNKELLEKLESLKGWDDFYTKGLYGKTLYDFLDDENVE